MKVSSKSIHVPQRICIIYSTGMAGFMFGVLPLLAVGGILMLVSLLLCLYLYRLRRVGLGTQGYKIVSSSIHVVSCSWLARAAVTWR